MFFIFSIFFSALEPKLGPPFLPKSLPQSHEKRTPKRPEKRRGQKGPKRAKYFRLTTEKRGYCELPHFAILFAPF